MLHTRIITPSLRIAAGRLIASLILSLLSGCGERPAPNVVLVSFDTMRADFLGAYGSSLGASPHLDAIAAEGVTFLSAISTSSWTRPAHFSILTGLYPDRRMATYGDGHGGCLISDEVATLAELLSDTGYETAAFTGGGYIHEGSGFQQGFDVFVTEGRRFEHNSDKLKSWIESEHPKPFFLFLHNYNVHRPYIAPDRYMRQFASAPPPECSGVDFSLKNNWQTCIAADGGRKYLNALYAAEIAYVDQQFGEFLDEYRKHHDLDNTILVVTSDHGDELLERGKLDHIRTLYRELINVPLIIRGPGIPQRVRVEASVGNIDILPTVLALLELAIPTQIDGTDILRSLSASSDRTKNGKEAPSSSARYAISGWRPEDRWGQEHTFSATVVNDGFKLIVNEGDEGDRGQTFELYDLHSDPGEMEQVLPVGRNSARMSGTLLSWVEKQSARTYCENYEISGAVKDQLEALGYHDP